jgi:hypothetical protein
MGSLDLGRARAKGRDRRSGWQFIAALAVVAIGAGCAPSLGGRQEAPQAPAANDDGRMRVIDHLTPARDSVGRSPSHFSWTPIEGADGYAIGVWNEVDQMVWRQDHIPTASIERPEDVRLEPGTYFWSVSALAGDQQLAAFVVRTVP